MGATSQSVTPMESEKQKFGKQKAARKAEIGKQKAEITR